MKISEDMVCHYLNDVTVSWFNNHDEPPDTVEGYLSLVHWMKQNAANHGDLKYLKLAFEYLLGNPDTNYEDFAGDRYPYDDDEVREIIEFAYKTIWPDAGPIPLAGPPDVKLVSIPLEEWWRHQKEN